MKMKPSFFPFQDRMTFRRHQIPQILGQIQQVLEKNIIDEDSENEQYVKYPKQVKQMKQLFNKYGFTQYIPDHEGHIFCKEDVTREAGQLRSIQLRRTYDKYTFIVIDRQINVFSFSMIQPITDEFINEVFGQHKIENELTESLINEYQVKYNFTYKISKFILENIDPNPEIDIRNNKLRGIDIKKSKYINHEHCGINQLLYQFKELVDKLNIQIYMNVCRSDYDMICLRGDNDNRRNQNHTNQELEQYFTSIDKIPDQFYDDSMSSQAYNQMLDYLLNQQEQQQQQQQQQQQLIKIDLRKIAYDREKETHDHKIFIANKQLLVIDDKLITIIKRQDGKLQASKPFKITSLQEHFGEEYAKQFQEITLYDLTNMILCDCVNREIIEGLI